MALVASVMTNSLFWFCITVVFCRTSGFISLETVTKVSHDDGELEIFARKNSLWSAQLRLKNESNGLRLLRITNEKILVKSIFDHSNQLADCDIVKDKDEIQSFIREIKARTALSQTEPNTAINEVFPSLRAMRKNCAKFHRSIDQLRQQKSATKTRSKRSILIFPGTNWCGKGNKAEYVSDFGESSQTDKCCLEHDACPYIIEGLTKNFGYFNYRLHTLSYCECDLRFRQCLREAGSGLANLVGKIYFNVVNTECFDLRRERRCARRSWWGSCNRWRMSLMAAVKELGDGY